MSPDPLRPPSDAIIHEVKARYSHTYNVSEMLITVSQSKVQLCIIDWLGRRSNWQTPATLLISTVLTLVTSQFHDVLFIKAIFWLLAAVALCLLVRELLKSGKRRGSINHLIDDIKGTAPE